MAGYEDTRELIINTLMGRPAGTEIQPEEHQEFALAITDYVRSVELLAGNAFIGFAEANTTPIQSDKGQCFYISTVGPGQIVNFVNFIDSNGNAISVSSPEGKMSLVTLIWNTQYWSSQIVTIDTNWSITQQSGSSESMVMSQKAVTEKFSKLEQKVIGTEINRTNGASWNIGDCSTIAQKYITIKNQGQGAILGIRQYDANGTQLQSLSVNIAEGDSLSVRFSQDGAKIGVFGGVGIVLITDGSELVNQVADIKGEISNINEEIVSLDNKINSLGFVELSKSGVGDTDFIPLEIIVGNSYKIEYDTTYVNAGIGRIRLYNAAKQQVGNDISVVINADNPNYTLTPSVNASFIKVYFTGTGKAKIYDLTGLYGVLSIEVEDANNKINSIIKFNNTNGGKRVTIKDFTQTINGFDYLAFGSGICFAGKEIHALRAAYEHLPRQLSSQYGKIVIFSKENNGEFNYFFPNIDYNAINQYGELRDVNLSKTRDGNYLLLSATSYTLAGAVNGFLFVLDKDFQVLHTINAIPNEFGWGNTLEDNEGYLLKSSYNIVGDTSNINIYKSISPITDGFENVSFEKVKTFSITNPSVRMNECTMSFVNSKLIIIVRGDNRNVRLYQCADLDPESEWTEYDLGYDLKSPCLLSHYGRSGFWFMGTWIKQASPILRVPAIIYYNLDTHTTERVHIVDDTLTHAGGYPSMVLLGENDIRTMYYDDNGSNSATALYYKRINPYLDCDMDYVL